MNPNDISEELDAIRRQLEKLGDTFPNDNVPESIRDKIAELARFSRRLVRKLAPPSRKPVEEEKAEIDPVLAELEKRLALVRDRVLGVAEHGHAGFYLYGRPGTAKTHTVRTTLERLGVRYVYQNGHITPLGLFEMLEANNEATIVLDDVAPVFRQPAAKNILLAALGSQPNGVRVINYKRQGANIKVRFTGGIIAISNMELHGDELIEALKSRVHTLNYDPSDDQIVALIEHIASTGHVSLSGKATPRECQLVKDHLLGECKKVGLRPDVRMYVDKALKDYLLWKSRESETHWKDLIKSAMEDRLTELKHTSNVDVPTKAEETKNELDRIEELLKSHSKEDAAKIFEDETGNGLRTFQRRLKALKLRQRKQE